jgi:GDPmannose 4,6-dehydratase
VTRKISRAVAEIAAGKLDTLYLGNIESKRDWGHAQDYVEGMWRMLQQEEAEDFVLATNETHPIKEFIEKAFKVVDIELRWEGEGIDEIAYDTKTNKAVVKIDEKYFRPAEVDLLHGDSTKAEKKLGWKRTRTFDQLVKEMVEADVVIVANPIEDQN